MKTINKFVKWFFTRFHISFTEFATVFTWVVLVSSMFYGVVWSGEKLADIYTKDLLETLKVTSLQ